ncbi:MAG: hypothetical protein HPY44_02605 [Armatimonadetes bacterium]|nr:hypothetical protein [Armatimonadota bacterium]
MSSPPGNELQTCAPFRLWEQNLPELELDRISAGEIDTGSEPDHPEASPRDPTSAHLRAQEILDRAQEQAEQVLDDARRAAARLEEETRQQALKAVADAQQEAFAEFLTLLRNSFEAELMRLWHEAEREAIELCAVAAEKVIRERIPRDDAVVVRAVRESLEQLRGASGVTVRVHPDCAAVLDAAASRLAADFPGAEGLQVECAPSLSPGGAVIRSDAGEVDLRIETQLARIRQALGLTEGNPQT